MCIFLMKRCATFLVRADCVTGFPGGQCDRSAINNRAFTIAVALFSSKARLPGVSRTRQNFALPRRRQVSRRRAHRLRSRLSRPWYSNAE